MAYDRIYWLAVSLAAASTPIAAAAQTPGQSAADAATAAPVAPAAAQPAVNDDSVVGEVIVTANRRESRLQDVPSAITAVDPKQLERRQIFDLTALASNVPSFSMTEGSGLAKELSIRGISSVRIVDASAEQSVGTFVDEIYVSRQGSAFSDFYDLERIEVIRGPQGVLLGKNVVGGAISVITAKPSFNPAGSLTASYGNYNSFRTTGFVTGALSSTVAARLAFQTRDRDGYGRNIRLNSEIDDLRSRQIRGELLFRSPDGSLQALLTADYANNKSRGSGARDTIDDPFVAGIGTLAAYRIANGIGPRESTSPQPEYVRSSTYGLSLRVDWEAFEGAKLTSLTGYRKSSGDVGYNQLGSSSPPAIVDTFLSYKESPRTLSQELRLVSDAPESRLDWIVGLYHQRDDVRRFDKNVATTSTAIAALDGTFLYDNNAKLRTTAAFGQLGYKFTDQLKLTAGARYTWDKKSGRRIATCIEDAGNQAPDGLCVAALALAGGQSFTVDYGRKWTAFTPQAILEYRPNEQIMAYASVAKGFKGGGWDHLPSTAVAARIGYNPETVMNYEVGVKSDLFGRRLRLNAAAFQMNYRDLQVQQLVTECLCLITSNAGTAKIKGLEVESTLVLGDGLRLFGAVTLLDATYDRFVDTSGVNYSGNRITRSPKYKYDIGASYDFGFGTWDRAFSLQSNYTRESRIFWTPANTISRPAYGVWNASLRVQPPGSNVSVLFFAKNLSNTLYAVAGQSSFGDLIRYFAPPRTYGAEVTFRF